MWRVAVPIFHRGEHFGFAAVTAHVLDVGGSFPGINADAFDVYAESKLYDGLRWYRRGELNHDLDRMIFGNVRTETMNRGDMEAMLAACELGRQRLPAVARTLRRRRRHQRRVRLDGLLGAQAPCRGIREDSGRGVSGADRLARRRRSQPRRPPAGRDETVRVEGDEITIDLTGSNVEVPTGYNVPFEGSLLVAAYFVIRHAAPGRGIGSPQPSAATRSSGR